MINLNSIYENISDYKVGFYEISNRIVKSTGIEFPSLDVLQFFSESVNDSDVLFEFSMVIFGRYLASIMGQLPLGGWHLCQLFLI
jgi:hypothetical protein